MNKTEFITLSFTILRRTFGVTFWSEKRENEIKNADRLAANYLSINEQRGGKINQNGWDKAVGQSKKNMEKLDNILKDPLQEDTTQEKKEPIK